jgi:hypothetical protein
MLACLAYQKRSNGHPRLSAGMLSARETKAEAVAHSK